MKTIILLSLCLSFLGGKAQNFNAISDTKVIMLTLKATPRDTIKMFDVEIKEVRITGTERNVTRYYYANKSLWGHYCDCYLLSATQCLAALKSGGFVTENVTGYTQLTKVKVEYPDPSDFNNVLSASRQRTEQSCDPNACVTFCSNQVCASVGCGTDVEMCYSGDFSVSASDGRYIVEAKIE